MPSQADAAKVQIIDRGWEALKTKARGLKNGITASVGIQGSEAERVTPEHGNLSNVELGAIHEFGAPGANIPERSHIRTTFDQNRPKYQMELKKIASGFFGMEPIEGSLFLLGEDFRRDIVKTIQGGKLEELAPATRVQRAVQQRGRGAEMIPLLVTGEYVGSFSSEVVDRRIKED